MLISTSRLAEVAAAVTGPEDHAKFVIQFKNFISRTPLLGADEEIGGLRAFGRSRGAVAYVAFAAWTLGIGRPALDSLVLALVGNAEELCARADGGEVFDFGLALDDGRWRFAINYKRRAAARITFSAAVLREFLAAWDAA